MPRIRKEIEAKQIRKFLKTNRRFSIVATLDAARLIDQKNNHYENKGRLYREITDGCKDAIDQIDQMIGRLPVEFRNEILQTKGVRSIRTFTVEAVRDARRAGKPFDQGEFDHYTNLLDESLQAITVMMPTQIWPLISPPVESLRNTLSCFSEFGQAYHLERKIPKYEIQQNEKKG